MLQENAVVVNRLVDNMVKKGYYIHQCSFTVAEGSDSIEHINRLITSNIKQINHLQSVESLICNANGRITDSLEILRIDNQILLLGNLEASKETRRLIVSGIHWNEDVRIMNGDGILTKVSFIGTKKDLLDIIPVGKMVIEDDKWAIWEEYYVKILDLEDTSKIDIILKSNEIEKILEDIPSGYKKLGEKDWIEFRVSNGILSFEEYKHNLLPSELGLDMLVDLKKGCYPGQEIHARMESRGKLKKKISRFKSNKDIELGKYRSKNGERINVTTSLGKTGFFLINDFEDEILIIDDIELRHEELNSIKIC
jgi:folate-binding protein YgfZ